MSGRYSESHWRNACAPIIARVIAENEGKNENAVRLALRDAYPYGQRKHHPYKIWLDEIARQLGKKPPLGTFGKKTKQRQEFANENQGRLDL